MVFQEFSGLQNPFKDIDLNLPIDNSIKPKPAMLPPIIEAQENKFSSFFEEDEETIALTQAKESNTLKNSKYTSYDEITKMLEQSFKDTKEQNPFGGVKASRFITADILLAAPQDYFDKYENDIREILYNIQNALSTQGKSEIIGRAQNEPLNDELQDEAYLVINSLIIDELNKKIYKGIERNVLSLLVSNEIIGFGKLDPLWRDRKIDEILCNGPFDVQVEISGRLFKVPSCKFRDSDHMMVLIEKLFSSIGKSVSRMTPLVKGRLHDKSRMFAVHTSVSPEGPNFSIRRHPESFWTPQDIVNRHSASKELMTEIGNFIYKGCSFLVIGGTSTGKTSMLNALTGFYKNDIRILTLEDNLELKPNPNKFLASAMECVPPRPDKPNDTGITMRDLVHASLQLRPDVILIGEVTDGAAYDLCQMLNTGHSGASTLHANDERDGVYRITSLVSQSGLAYGDSVLPLIATAFDFVIFLEHYPIDGSRRISSISEISSYAEKGDDGRVYLPTYPLWKFHNTGLVDGKITGNWEKVGDMSSLRKSRRHLEIERDLTWEELVELSKV